MKDTPQTQGGGVIFLKRVQTRRTRPGREGLAGDLWVHASFGVQQTFEQRCQLSASVFAAPQVLCV